MSLVELFTDYLAQKGEYDAAAEAAFSPALCNRIDRGTEGLVLAAKNYAALRDMNELIRRDLLQKEYYCITAGVPPKGRHTAYLRHFEKNNKVDVRAETAPGYKEIITDVAILQTKGPCALCRIGLVTGRTHQIRVHMAGIGHPAVGDDLYGGKTDRTNRQLLRCTSVRIVCPVLNTDKTVAADFTPAQKRLFPALFNVEREK